jgi:Domain of unknown function (DUF4157)
MHYHLSRSADAERSRSTHAASSSSRSPTHHRILQLQRLVGNRAVSAAVARHLQPQLRVGRSDDAFEREADRTADCVMRLQEPSAERTCTECGVGERGHGTTVARATESGIPAEAPPIVDEVLSKAGRPLDPDVRAFMEPRFGHDFSRVHVHAGAQAAESARAIDAVAYTVGPDIVFDKGEYRPDTSDGRRLLAHELTHVIQQGASDPSILPNVQDEADESTRS